MDENDIANFAIGGENDNIDDKNNIVNGANDNVDDGLAIQHPDQIDLETLSVETLEVISRQATVNIGTIGHVAHGKSTVVKALSGVKTQKYNREAVMNITIYLGYANAKVYQCPVCPHPQCFNTYSSSQPDNTPCPHCHTTMQLKRHFSFVDCPGHDVLMATMLNGAAIMDAALLLIAVNESFPQPQTLEHLKAVEIMKLRHLIVLQNKIDLVSNVKAYDQYRLIRSYLDKIALEAPIIPISAQLKQNIDCLLEYLVHIPLPKRKLKCPMRMTVVRSFDINRPGESDIEQLKGGVAGGTVLEGIIKVGQYVEIRPGLIRSRAAIATSSSSSNATSASNKNVTFKRESRFNYTPLQTRIISLKAENNSLEYAIPGGLIAVGTTLDPTLTRQDKMVGHMLGDPNTLPEVYCEMDVQYYLFSEVVGTKASRDAKSSGGGSMSASSPTSAGAGGFGGTSAGSISSSSLGVKRVQKLNIDESLQINVGTLTAGASVVSMTTAPEIAKLTLMTPVCCCIGEQVAISRLVDKNFRLIGWGTIRRGVPVEQRGEVKFDNPTYK